MVGRLGGFGGFSDRSHSPCDGVEFALLCAMGVWILEKLLFTDWSALCVVGTLERERERGGCERACGNGYGR